MGNSHRSRRLAALLVFSSGRLVTSAWAAAPSEPAGVANQLEEIVVTAQKREQSLNDVGLTVNALSKETLQTRQIATLADLSQAIPSLSFTQSPWGTPVLTLRGVGYYETALAASPAVAAYLDEAPLAYPALSTHVNLDLERVEVLNGPQGTLFGQNSTGVAINFIAAKPTREFTAAATLTYGRFNQVNEEAYVSGPLSSTLSARFAERQETSDGWQRSTSRPGDTNGSVHNQMARLLLDFHPSDDVKFMLNINGWNDRSQPAAAQLIGINNQHAPADLPVILVSNPPFSPADPRAADWNPGFPKRDNNMFQTSLRGDFKLPGDLTLVSLSNYVKFHRAEAIDYDGVPVRINDFSAAEGMITTFSQELRLSNATRNPIRWTVGANYERDTIDQLYNYQYNESSTALAFGIAQNIFTSQQKVTTYAGFGDIEFDVSKAVTLKGGVRYTNNKQAVNNCGYDYTPPYAAGNLFYQFLSAHPHPYIPGDCFPLNDLGYAVGAVVNGDPGRFINSLDQHNVSWRVGMDWKPEPGTLVYMNISKGFKSATFPTTGASAFSQYIPVTQESMISYEPGFKLSLLDRRMQLNGALFYYDYKDKQIRSRIIDPIFNQLDGLQNIPKSSVRGAELEVQYRPVQSFTLGASFSYIDAKIDRFSGINAAGVAAVFDGTKMPYTPKFQVNANGDYVTPVSGNVNLFLGATVSYRSSTNAIIGGEANPPGAIPTGAPLFRVDSYTLVDLRAGIERDNWRVFLWGKNVGNTYYWNNVNPSFDVLVRYAGLPATYGITATYRVY